MTRGRRPINPVWLAGVAALVPAIAVAATSETHAREAGAGAPAAAFKPPEGPLVLTRVLERSLPDGKAIVSRRSYAVRFLRDGDGYRLDGSLLSVSVEVPDVLEALADLERRRPDTGLFPMRIDVAGTLLAAENPSPPDPAVAMAAQQVSLAISGAGLSPGETRQAHAFVDRVRSQSMHTEWPADLFMPRTGRRQQLVPVPLPDGKSGEVSVVLEARAGSGGLLSWFRRTVTTELAGTTRRSTETWTLTPG